MTCGECKHFVAGEAALLPKCDAPYPIWIEEVIGSEIRYPEDPSGSCPCFERKEAE